MRKEEEEVEAGEEEEAREEEEVGGLAWRKRGTRVKEELGTSRSLIKQIVRQACLILGHHD